MVRIREARPADASVINAIQCESLAAPWPELLDVALSAASSPSAPELAWCLVANSEGKLVGYALGIDGDQCYLAEIAVDPNHRREGYASALLEAVIDRTDCEEIWLTARVGDSDARAFYEHHGFQVIERLPGHFERKDDTNGVRDGLLLSKRLN